MIPARVPTREQVRQHECPRCGAQAGQGCTQAGRYRPQNHHERVERCQAWLGKQLQLQGLA